MCVAKTLSPLPPFHRDIWQREARFAYHYRMYTYAVLFSRAILRNRILLIDNIQYTFSGIVVAVVVVVVKQFFTRHDSNRCRRRRRPWNVYKTTRRTPAEKCTAQSSDGGGSRKTETNKQFNHTTMILFFIITTEQRVAFASDLLRYLSDRFPPSVYIRGELRRPTVIALARECRPVVWFEHNIAGVAKIIQASDPTPSTLWKRLF